MGLSGSDSSSNSVMFHSNPSLKNNKMGCSKGRDSELSRPQRSGFARNSSIKFRIHGLGPICKSRKKAAALFLESKEEEEEEEDDDDGDFVKRFGEEGWFDDDKGTWLSSGTLSPSSCLDDHRLSILLDLDISLEELLVSLLSFVVPKDIIFFDGSTVNPIVEASLVLKRTSSDAEQILKEDLKDEEVVTWLSSSIGIDPTDSSLTCSESQSSSCSQSCDGCSISDNALSPVTKKIDSSRQSWDSERTGFWVSSFNLEGEDSRWISDTEESELDCIQSGLPSPYCKSSWGLKSQCSNSSFSSLSELVQEKSQSVSSSEYVLEDSDLADMDADEPIFWPPDTKSDWGSEVKWEFLVMSPCKHRYMDRKSSESIRLSLHNRKMDIKMLELKHTNDKKDVRRMKTMPSRLGKLAKISKKIVLDEKDGALEPTSEGGHIEKYKKFMGDDDFASNRELAIETLLGLDEFDGHEGIESEFNRDDFSLDESL